jgi:DNA mismatch repair protein MutS
MTEETSENLDISTLTPMMQQWATCKKRAPHMVLLFRMGDFYEAFYEDAATLAHELELTLTKRQGIPMAGVPWHSADTYIDRLVSRGHKVALAEQVEDPKQAKGLVRREIVRVITPGTRVTSAFLSEKQNNYILSLAQLNSVYGLSALDISTGEFKVTECETPQELFNELARLHPTEFLIPEKLFEKHKAFFENHVFTLLKPWQAEHQTALRTLQSHFEVHTLDGYGLGGMVAGINAAGALLSYVKEDLSLSVTHIEKITPYTVKESLRVDANTSKHLELFRTLQGGKKQGSLLGFLDQTATPMGGRLLSQWLARPLLSAGQITARLESVEELYYARELRMKARTLLKSVRDLERLTMKISAGLAGPKDVKALHTSLVPLTTFKGLFKNSNAPFLKKLEESVHIFTDLVAHFERALSEEPPLRISEGGVFKEGYHPELDELKQLAFNGREWLQRYQDRLREEIGIKTLKVGHTRVFGYYIEVSKGQASAMPPHFHRKQTLANNERFISEELRQYEEKLNTSFEKQLILESELFENLKQEILGQKRELFETAQALAHLDVLLCFAELAQTHHFCRPEVDLSPTLKIEGGRHPVVEQNIGRQNFISNDTHLDDSTCQLALITGPNMAGKSTYIRQVALITILAQMGSFVPATHAHIGIVDQIFTRIGASDDLSKGQSTFMVEMTETANILNNATSRSLVILDEIGRGTSTYDGISIAWSVAEYLLKTVGHQAKTLFATHYWELTQLETLFDKVQNFHATVEEWNEEILFLHKIAKGCGDKSYGIHVARLAGLPQPVIMRAKQILQRLEARKEAQTKKESRPEEQLLLFK